MNSRSGGWMAALLALSLACPPTARADDAPDTAETARHRFYVGTSLFMAANLLPNPPSFYQLNLGWRPTDRDSFGVEAITWTYTAPLGIPYGPRHGDPAYEYPGHVRDLGIGVSYQRFWWKGVYTQVHAVPFVHRYVDEDRRPIRTGFLLFTTLRAGYHLGAWHDRVFVEPSVACTWWPVETGTPRGFAAMNDQFPNLFLLEPGLHVGVNL